MAGEHRVLHIMMNLLHAQATLTGTGYYALNLARALLKLPERPHVLGVCSPFNVEAFCIPGQERYEQLVWGRPHESVMARRFEEWTKLGATIRARKPDVFFGPSNFLPWGRIGGRMVVTIHDMTFFEHPEFLHPIRRFYWHAWTRRTIKVADAILTVSEAAKRDIVKYGDANPDCITVAHNGTGEAFYVGRDLEGGAARRTSLRERFPQLPDRYVFFLGTLTSHKNVPRLIEAVARAHALDCEGLQLVMAGKRGTGYEQVADAIARNNLGGAVHELGYVEDEWLPALYENARAHVLPSFTEGFGLPITEAMAAGTPVITSNVGAMAEVAGDAGVLVDPTDTEAMAQALKRLWYDNGFHAECRARGLARAENFTWAESARKTYAVLAGEV